ncbi:beta-ketoacyl synthase chain length factor [Aurantibacter crassamenti]|uniref:beta-ketoacyl synthase N-terminal-like domain-containing protein n=1 Tax=Aurantibacter crassamenti TaxID=1837375 RepID=UPI001939DF31|nr:beta-ketoacyl synthase N-terminal-like domain-containing protein [Aurantibacter crassamenti]MBM1105516.1 beta-ketoacyl synthase chain length factor [Aurantibacter crassamenti]
MKKSVYINSVGSVSPQNTLDNSVFLDEIVNYEDTTLAVISPNYKEFIPPAAARRMAKGIKMSTASAKTALSEAQIEESAVDAIIVGTGLGCIGDSEKFIKDIIDNDEQYLTPTRFIQSSHNTVAGQIALGMGCKGHNFTYVHSSSSFESSLLDAKMQLEENEAKHILVGGVDELVDHHENTHRFIGHIKKTPVHTNALLTSKSKGAVFSEGANFFLLSNEKTNSVYSQLIALKTFNTIALERIESLATDFLSENNLSIKDIDLIVMGNNGDIEFDAYYDELSNNIFKETPQAYYKHLSGEFDTASAFGFWLANKILKNQNIPKAVQMNSIQPEKLQTILLYNQYRGENQSFVLLKGC